MSVTKQIDDLIHKVQQAMDEMETVLYTVERLEKENYQLRGLAFEEDEELDIVDELRGSMRLDMVEQGDKSATCEVVKDELSERAADIIERLREENYKLRKALSND